MSVISTPASADLRGNQQSVLDSFLANLSVEIGGIDPLSDAGAVALQITCAAGKKFTHRLGGTTYRYAMWAAVDPRNGQVLVIETGDDRGRWMSAACRPWNGGNKL